jgi:hypothetical protein
LRCARKNEYRKKHYKQCRKDPPRAPMVKVDYAILFIIKIIVNNSCNQKSGYDEEHIDANKPAWGNAKELIMKGYDWKDGDRPQPVNV